jgi:hypothetical protein
LNAGDSANLPTGKDTDADEVAKSEQELTNVLQHLEAAFPDRPVYYIGGNVCSQPTNQHKPFDQI